ncbi:MAG: maleylpyruvate isomerase N-terminal domain-containing protein [Actinomycetes bacterium]
MTALLPWPDLLTAVEREGALLLRAARAAGLGVPVPSCPGWTVEDLVRHTAQVYEHKVQCIRLGAPPEPWPPDRSAAEPLAWFAAALDAVVDELRSHEASDSAWTWFPEDQTVGFWIRRMAQETLIHRVDAELAAQAAHALSEISPIDPALAVDGIDELLAVFLDDDWSEWPGSVSAPPPFTVVVTAGDARPDRAPADGASPTTGARAATTATWRLRIEPSRVSAVRESGGAAADVTVAGPPAEVLLWLWARGGDDAVTVTGGEGLQQALRDRLTAATQ